MSPQAFKLREAPVRAPQGNFLQVCYTEAEDLYDVVVQDGEELKVGQQSRRVLDEPGVDPEPLAANSPVHDQPRVSWLKVF